MENQDKNNTNQIDDDNAQPLPHDHSVVELEEEDNRAQEIELLSSRITELDDKLLRVNAESENMRRRYNKMIEEARDYAIVNFAKDLIAVMDNLSRALEYKSEDSAPTIKTVMEGVEMTKAELHSIFAKNGLEAIEPKIGEKFDYNLHQAISQIETDEYNEGSIVSIMQVGYKIKDRLLRPAIVTVSK